VISGGKIKRFHQTKPVVFGFSGFGRRFPKKSGTRATKL
jgi:hypothetical protein